MPLEIAGALFTIDNVVMTPGARMRAAGLQAKLGRTGDEALMVHSTVLLRLHATGQHGDLPISDRRLNRNNIAANSGKILSVVGWKFPFVIITELPSGETLISTPEEV